MNRHFLIAFIFPVAAAAHPLRILIDPGHGGKDHGTVHRGVHEADITLSVSEKLAALLKKNPAFDVELTRTSDQTVSLRERAVLAKKEDVDLFVSIHVNSSPDTHAKGAEFYFQNQLPPDQESMYLAHQENLEDSDSGEKPLGYDFIEKNSYPSEVNSILTDLLDSDRILLSSRLSKTLKLNWRGTRKSSANSIRQAPFYVLNQLRAPSTLVELGFLSNPHDYRQLVDPASQSRMAHDLYRGLIAYKDSMDKPQTAP